MCTAPAKDLLFEWDHAAAMCSNHPVMNESDAIQELAGKHIAMRLHRRHFTPDLIQMNGANGVKLLLQRPQLAQQFR
jgi:hypothetical protein